MEPFLLLAMIGLGVLLGAWWQRWLLTDAPDEIARTAETNYQAGYRLGASISYGYVAGYANGFEDATNGTPDEMTLGKSRIVMSVTDLSSALDADQKLRQ